MSTEAEHGRSRGAADISEVLCRELGGERVIVPDADGSPGRLEDYGRDESLLGTYLPECAVLCETREEVAAVLAIAAERRVPVTPRGAGSGKTGGCLPVRGGIVLSTERMARIREIDGDDLVCVVEPGVITGDLQAAVAQDGLFYPPDPASLSYCSIGGNAASNAGGPRAFKYGVTRHYVLGLEAGLMGGELLRVGRRTSKGVSGYDLTGGFVGTEGTFGVITELTLRLLPAPASVATALVVFADMDRAARAVTSIIARGFRPRVLELMDRTVIDHVRRYGGADGRGARYPFPRDAGAGLLIELDGDADGLEASLLRALALCDDIGALDIAVATDSARRRDLWDARRSVSPSLKRGYPTKISHDICVPRGALVEMLARIDRLGADLGLAMATYGHAGDGNLHVNMLVDRDPADAAARDVLERAQVALFEHTIALGGTLSGEHGIGLSKKRFMGLEHSARSLEWQRRWKRMWDPMELLNPGKVLPDGALALSPGCHE